ncbi:putative transmembrane protein [Trypanosoma rangeli]|uniref:Putative transmembrane protein n=1 Tax=Trypanosoma rangeli TaxID=5698 RepID=A0A3R7KKV7_TRYRA|nr:putative transmembrane protein [Trypanosoma rangeli]RNF09504.1 putative transmembrane protein [Trypanosoma rangeli]|eukprot:RNF09504.1 putative transmembrane protein [Trypanosoma rangeli]
MVVVALLSILYMIADRMLYVTRCMKGKLLLNILSGVGYCLCYLLWGHLVTVRSRFVGNVFFTLKIIALTIAVLQLRVGYPRHRRHDPFTYTAGRSWVAASLYALYRGVPFLWEVRVVTDWTVEKTALNLDDFLTIEDLYHIVFERRCKIHEAREQQPMLGMSICRSAKLSVGLLRLAMILLALMAPLVYYSTFNPSIESNKVMQLRVGLSFMSLQPFYVSTTFTTETIPNDWALWLARTRPSLDQEGIMNTKKTLQLVPVSSCSNDLWSISPHAFRQLNEQLTAAMNNKTDIQLYQSLELSRSGTSNPVLYARSWTFSWKTAREIHHMLNSPVANDTKYVLLQNFYSPFFFAHPDGFSAFDDGTGKNVIDCSIVLRQDVEPMLNSTVRYWCVKCQSLFTGGNVPSDNLTRFPEWHCLSTGEGCNNFDFERQNGDGGYNPVSMYFVILSDPSVGGVSFLQGIGIVALYTTFVLALGRIFRGMFSDKAKHAVLTAMADPTPVAQLIEYIELARECSDLRLEQSVYFELVDLLRSPERLLRLTGFNRRLYDVETEVLQSPNPSASTPVGDNSSRDDDPLRDPVADASTASEGAHERRE